MRSTARSGLRIAAVAGALAALGGLIATRPGLGGLVVALLLSWAAVFVVTFVVTMGAPEDDRRDVVRWTAVSFGLHVFIGLVIVSFGQLTSYLGPDAGFYHGTAVDLLRSWTSGGPRPVLPPGKSGFIEALAVFYRWTTPSMQAGVILNAGFAAAVVPLVSDMTAGLFGRRLARKAPMLVALFPPLLIWPAQVLREASVLFLLAVIGAASVRLVRSTRPLPLAALAAATALLLDFRGPLAYALLAGVVLASVLARQHVVAGVSNAGAVAMGLIVLVGVVGFGHEGFEYSADQELKSASDFRVNVSSDAESGFDDVTETRSAAEVIAYMPVAGPRALLGPTPLAVHSVRQVPAVLDAVICWWTLLMAVRGFRRARELGSRRRLLVLLIPAAVVLVVLAVTLGNYGILVRQRPQIIVFLLPLVAFELALRSAVPEVVPLPELASVASPTAAARAVHAHHHRRRGPRTVPLFARLHDDR